MATSAAMTKKVAHRKDSVDAPPYFIYAGYFRYFFPKPILLPKLQNQNT